MSGRLASITHRHGLPARTLWPALFPVPLLLALVLGTTTTTAQPLEPTTNQSDPFSPVPPDDVKGRSPEDFKIPGSNTAAMFAKIRDFEKVASEAENPDEYRAWCAFVSHIHVKNFTAAELEQRGVRNLIAHDLKQPTTLADHRCQLVRFEGKAVCVRRLKAPRYFTDNPESSIRELYEARFVPLDESPLNPVSIVFLELPKELAEVAKKPFKESGNASEWLDVDLWIRAAGYFFKAMSVPDGAKDVRVPLLVGKSVTPLPGPPAPQGDDPTAIDRDMRIFKFIQDDTKMIRPNAPWEEYAACNRVLIHASRFSAEEVESHARTDVMFADLFEEVRIEHRLKCVKFEGRLISLRLQPGLNPELKAAGINQVYEGWLVPSHERSGNPVCIMFTEPLEGVEPGPDDHVSKWVTFAGYSFKRMRYESREKYPDESKGYKDKLAPLLIGKKPIVRPDPQEQPTITWGLFLEVAVAGVMVMILIAGTLGWWYRRTDRKARESIEAVRNRNPFDNQ